MPKSSDGISGSNNVNGKVGKGHQWIIGPELTFEGGRSSHRSQRRNASACLISNESSPFNNVKPPKENKKKKSVKIPL